MSSKRGDDGRFTTPLIESLRGVGLAYLSSCRGVGLAYLSSCRGIGLALALLSGV